MLALLLSHGSHGSKVTLPYQLFRPRSTWEHPIPRMLSVQMGRASDTCSIKGIRGDLTTSLSASWPHIDQPVWDHSQSVWQLNLEPCTFTHTYIHSLRRAQTRISHTQSDEDILWILHRYTHVYLSVSVNYRRQSKRRRKRFLEIGSVSFIANCQAMKTNGCLSFSFLVKPADIRLLG